MRSVVFCLCLRAQHVVHDFAVLAVLAQCQDSMFLRRQTTEKMRQSRLPSLLAVPGEFCRMPLF